MTRNRIHSIRILCLLAAGSLFVMFAARRYFPPGFLGIVIWLWILGMFAIVAAIIYRRGGTDDHVGRCRKCDYDLTGNVSGRCPECGLDRLGSIVLLLQHRELVFRLKGIGSIVLGLVLLPIGPFVLATVFWLAFLRLGRFVALPEGVPWSWLFIGLCVLMIPLLFRLELRTQGKNSEDGLDDSIGPGFGGIAATPGLLQLPYAAVSAGVNARSIGAMVTGVFLLGPRAILWGLQRRRIAWRLQGANRVQAGQVLSRLADSTEGMETSMLLEEGQNLTDLQPVLAYLLHYQWIGVGDQWHRVWLWSFVRPPLNATRVGPSAPRMP